MTLVLGESLYLGPEQAVIAAGAVGSSEWDRPSQAILGAILPVGPLSA